MSPDGAKRETMTWDAATNTRLLLAVINYYGDAKLDYALIAGTMGPNCSPRAVQEQIKKLKKDAKAISDETNPNFNAAPTEPVKATSKKAPRAKAAPKAKEKAKQGTEIPTDDEEDDVKPVIKEETSRKKRKIDNSGADASASETISGHTAEAMDPTYEEIL